MLILELAPNLKDHLQEKNIEMDLKVVSSESCGRIFFVAEDQSKDGTVNRSSNCLLFLVKKNTQSVFTNFVTVLY
jgi:hypothetical protein